MKKINHLNSGRNQLTNHQYFVPSIRKSINMNGTVKLEGPKVESIISKSHIGAIRNSLNPIRSTLNKIETIYGLSLKQMNSAKKFQLSRISPFCHQDHNKFQLSSLKKYPTKVIPMNTSRHRNFLKEYINSSSKDFKIDMNSDDLNEKYHGRIVTLIENNANKEVIGQLFIDLFKDLSLLIPNYKRIFSASMELAQILTNNNHSKRKSMIFPLFKTQLLDERMPKEIIKLEYESADINNIKNKIARSETYKNPDTKLIKGYEEKERMEIKQILNIPFKKVHENILRRPQTRASNARIKRYMELQRNNSFKTPEEIDEDKKAKERERESKETQKGSVNNYTDDIYIPEVVEPINNT